MAIKNLEYSIYLEEKKLRETKKGDRKNPII